MKNHINTSLAIATLIAVILGHDSAALIGFVLYYTCALEWLFGCC